ncbi:MAG TPA: 16S rRNA (cytosine(1402)-N(4))-methyltransferase RsmH, partial [Burkholderiales bacterium]
MHQPVLLSEALDALAIRPDGLYVDGTFGRGGHSRAILERLGERGRLIALDRDPEAARAAGEIEDTRFSFVRAAFSSLSTVLGAQRADGMLFDLGVSSPQLDEAARGFSFQAEGPLDMRMERAGKSAADLVNELAERPLADLIFTFGEEKKARRVAKAIVAARALAPISTTQRLAEIVRRAIGPAHDRIDPATRTFQALRI